MRDASGVYSAERSSYKGYKVEMSNELQGRKRKYFVVFDYWKASNIHGIASRVIERDTPVSDWEDILSMMEYILSCNPDMKLEKV
jgi:hypothetical protein